jgi:hypothetical protein
VSGSDADALAARFDKFGHVLPDSPVARLTRTLVKRHGWKRVKVRNPRRRATAERPRERRPGQRRQSTFNARSTSSNDPGDDSPGSRTVVSAHGALTAEQHRAVIS